MRGWLQVLPLILWVASAHACDVPENYEPPTFAQQLSSAKNLSAFAFRGVIISSRITSTEKQFLDRDFHVEFVVRNIETYFGKPPSRPRFDYMIEFDPGAACSPLEPHVGQEYIFFDPNTSVVHNSFQNTSNVHPQFRVQLKYSYDEPGITKSVLPAVEGFLRGTK